MLARLDHLFFGLAGLSSVWLAYLLARESRWSAWQVLLLVVFWLLVAYLVLPRLQRMLTTIYVPDYFIGRTRTSDGLLGDPVNLALLGSEAQLHTAMASAGWVRADPITLASSAQIVRTTLSRRSYPTAPVSPLNLFGRPQDVAYQQEVDGNPAQRHHVRFWRCPEGWLLPGGFAADWLAAATYDRRVGLSLFTLQVTHKIAADTDVERDHTVGTMTTDPRVSVRVIEDFSAGYHARNGGGDSIRTDGDLPVVDLRRVAATTSDQLPPPTAGRRRRPPTTIFGAGVVVVRALVTVVLGIGHGVDADLAWLVTGAAVAALADLVLGVAVYLGSNLGRVVVLAASVVAVGSAFLDAVLRHDRPTFATTLPTVALSVLVMLALSSHAARDWSVRRQGETATASASPAA